MHGGLCHENPGQKHKPAQDQVSVRADLESLRWCLHFFITILWLGNFSAVQAEVELTAISPWALNVEFAEDLQLFVEAVNVRGKGRVHIRYLGGPEVIPQRQMVYALRRGVVDVYFGAATYLIGVVPEGDAFLGASVTPIEARRNGAYEAIQDYWMEKLNAFFLGWHQTGYRLHIFTRAPPVFRSDGLPNVSGLRIRTTPTYRAFLKAVGATPIDIPSSEVYTALERGTVDAIAWTSTSMSNQGFQKFVHYRIDPGVLNPVMTLQVNLDRWRSLSTDVQELLMDESLTYERESRERFKAKESLEKQVLAAEGMTYVGLSASAADKYRSLAADAVWARMERRVPESVARLRPLFDPAGVPSGF